ncbi:MAG TPA: NAD(P)-dependent oxidoreductase [Gaiellaceae bacterium]
MGEERFLVTGAHGCIGAWVVHELIGDGSAVTTFDLSTDPRRLRLLLDDAALAAVPHVAGDISDLAALERALDEHGITNVIHLAALQVPFCRADPPLGARVNVVGTVNVLEAARRRAPALAPVVYASSVGAYDAPEEHAAPSMAGHPGTLYGVFKRANESTASVFWTENGLSSVGLRPHTVYGPGRDQGLTSAATTAMLAAATGVPYRIPFGGAAQLQYARDVARAFIAASFSGHEGASVHNVPGPRVTIAEVVDAIAAAAPESAGTIAFDDVVLPFPDEVDSGSFDEIAPGFASTPLAEGVHATIERFRTLVSEGLVDAPPPA